MFFSFFDVLCVVGAHLFFHRIETLHLSMQANYTIGIFTDPCRLEIFQMAAGEGYMAGGPTWADVGPTSRLSLLFKCA